MRSAEPVSQRLRKSQYYFGGNTFGDRPTLADVYVVPQIESARRFKVDLARWPRLAAIDEACGRLDAFRRAAPAVQPDAG